MPINFHEELCNVPFYPKADVYGSHDDIVLLASNENPYPPSEKVFAAIIDAVYSLNRYPEGEEELKRLISARFGLEPENIVIGNGSNEIIELALKALKHKYRMSVIVPEPSFPFYGIAARVQGYTVKPCPLKGMHLDLEGILDLIDHKTRIIFLNNPHNPTGTIFCEKEFLSFLRRMPEDILVVLDEAYAEFVESRDFPSLSSYIYDYPVLVLRTFSKAFAIAGLRVGYGMGDKNLIYFLEKTKQPFSTNYLGIRAAIAALEDEEYLKKVIANIRKGKNFLYRSLESLGVEFVKSESNFFLVKLGAETERIYRALLEERIVVRWMKSYGLSDYIRITVGRMNENRIFIETLKRLLR